MEVAAASSLEAGASSPVEPLDLGAQRPPLRVSRPGASRRGGLELGRTTLEVQLAALSLAAIDRHDGDPETPGRAAGRSRCPRAATSIMVRRMTTGTSSSRTWERR